MANDERSHIDVLTKANRALLEQMRAMKQAGDDLAAKLDPAEHGNHSAFAAAAAITAWKTASQSMI